MFETFRTAFRDAGERASQRRQHQALLRLDDHLLRDIGLGRDDFRARSSR